MWAIYCAVLLLGLPLTVMLLANDGAFASAKLGVLLPLLLLTPLLILVSIPVREFKYIIVDKADRKLKYYSLLKPWGTTIDLTRYKGYYTASMNSSYVGTPSSLCLVDHSDLVSLRLNGMYYQNFDEIVQAVGLKPIPVQINAFQNLLLLMVGRLKVQIK